MKFASGAIIAAVLAMAGQASAAVTTYTSQSAFQTALTDSFTLVGLDAAPFNAGSTLSALSVPLAAAGLVSVGADAPIFAGQNYQSPGSQDRMIANGSAFGGLVMFNFTGLVHGVGAVSNNIDYGRVRIFSGANGTGALLGQAQFGPGETNGGFGGLISTTAIGSVQFTCDYNSDNACGIYDVQFGATAVPEPAAWGLMILGFAATGAALRRQRKPALV